MKAVIMAGGKGTRILTVNSAVPKPMINIGGKPILEYQIECLRKQHITDIILVTGHLGNVIEEYFGNGRAFHVNIDYIREEYPLGTAGALYYLKDRLTEDFLLINGDIIFDVNMDLFFKAHRKKQSLATILTHPNDHPYDSGIIIADQNGMVLKWLVKEEERKWYKNRVNAGIHILSPALLTKFETLQKRDLDRDILKPLISEKRLYVYDSPEYIKDMGTPERLYEVKKDIASGMVIKRNLSIKQKAVFLDRDGTINKYAGFLNCIDDFFLLENVAEAIRMINQSGYLAIVITNQPVIARGELSWEQLVEIHNKMETLLGNAGAYVNDIFCCPHHPHSGYAGERTEYKKECECRKPKPGMLLNAARKYNIDLRESWMIGDSINDIEAGQNAGCKVAYLGESLGDDIPCYKNLLDCVLNILET
jgi:D-glycero-D-manno-heptose 1,7-bisphosphate phosphatase